MQEHKRIVDSNEPFEDIIAPLLKVGWERQKLFSGDMFFLSVNWQKIGVERKEVSDLINSIGSGRMANQLQNMLDYYDISILLIEGSLRVQSGQILNEHGGTRWLLEAYRNFIRTWQDRGITIERTTDSEDTVERLKELYAYYQKPCHTGGYTRKIAGDPRLLAFPPSVGAKTGKKILDHFGSLSNVAVATVDDLMSVDDVGAKRAEAIRAFFHKDGRNE